MSPSPLREWVKADPFRPFRITTADCRTVHVARPGMIILGNRRDTVAWVDADGYDRLAIIEHAHIASVDAYDPVQSSTPEG